MASNNPRLNSSDSQELSLSIRDIRHLVDSILVPHKAFEVARKRINQCMEAVTGSAEPICIPVIGEAGTGKTRFLENINSNYMPVRKPDGLRVPILRIRTPSNPTVKGFCEVLLRALGDPMPGKGTETNMIHRLIELIKAVGVILMMLDEFQHFYDKKSQRVMHHIADTLKLIVDESRVALVVSGLPSCRYVLEQNEQLARRALAPISMPRFDWNSAEDQDEFFAILGAFQTELSSVFEMPDLDSDEMAFRFYCATGGLIGYMSKILRLATWNAIDENRHVITLDDLDLAYRDAVLTQNVWNGKTPFQRGFKTSLSEDLLLTARTIGVPVPEQHSSRTPRSASHNISATTVLRT